MPKTPSKQASEALLGHVLIGNCLDNALSMRADSTIHRVLINQQRGDWYEF